MSKNLHDKPFDETTITKLEIFEDYAQAWLPTFVMAGDPVICIFDFFAGTGYDVNNVPGSPIRILKKVREQIGYIFQKKVRIKIYFNEFDKKKYDQLVLACDNFLTTYPEVGRAIDLHLSQEDFDKCFDQQLPTIRAYSSLVYLDQNGIKFLADKYLLELEKTTRTDFIYFVSSSYFWRFGEKEEFKTHVKLDIDEAKKNPYKFIHRTLITQLKTKLPSNSKLKLYPFSLKKGANVHGIIFGGSHIRAVDKFLSIVWKRNEVNGEANFDIDDDRRKNQLNLFVEKPLTKIEGFQQRLREQVLLRKITDNAQAFHFAMEEGHLGSQAAEELKKMKQELLINYDGISPLVTYQNVYQLSRQLTYKVLT